MNKKCMKPIKANMEGYMINVDCGKCPNCEKALVQIRRAIKGLREKENENSRNQTRHG